MVVVGALRVVDGGWDGSVSEKWLAKCAASEKRALFGWKTRRKVSPSELQLTCP